MGAKDDSRLWQEGNLAGASGETLLAAITEGRMWLNLRNVSGVDPAYRRLLDAIFHELHQTFPGFAANKWKSGILISSPGRGSITMPTCPASYCGRSRGARESGSIPAARRS